MQVEEDGRAHCSSGFNVDAFDADAHAEYTGAGRAEVWWQRLIAVWQLPPGVGRAAKAPPANCLKQSCSEAHINARGGITSGHAAFHYLQHNTLSPSIDRRGNFVWKANAALSRGSAARIAAAHGPRWAGKSWKGQAEFFPEWEDEFIGIQYQMDTFHKWMGLSSWAIVLTCIGTVLAPLGSMPEDCPFDSWSSRGLLWRLILHSPAIGVGVVSLLVRMAIKVENLECPYLLHRPLPASFRAAHSACTHLPQVAAFSWGKMGGGAGTFVPTRLSRSWRGGCSRFLFSREFDIMLPINTD